MNKNKNYANIEEFGRGIDDSYRNPLTYCLLSAHDNQFMHGSGSSVPVAGSKECQEYMSDLWAEHANTDDQSDRLLYSHFRNATDVSLNNICIQNSTSKRLVKQLTNGQSLLLNTAWKRYGRGNKINYPFDPLVANSPLTTSFSGDVVCVVDPQTIDDDPFMDLCLKNYNITMDVLINIAVSCKKFKIDLTNTKIGEFQKQYFEHLNK